LEELGWREGGPTRRGFVSRIWIKSWWEGIGSRSWEGGVRIKKKDLEGAAVWTKGRSELEKKESLMIRGLLPFAVSHNKIVKISENIGIKSAKFRPFWGVI
jgi:hypothetical protein